MRKKKKEKQYDHATLSSFPNFSKNDSSVINFLLQFFFTRLIFFANLISVCKNYLGGDSVAKIDYRKTRKLQRRQS